MSSAPASNTRRTKPLGAPLQSTTTGRSGRLRRASAIISITASLAWSQATTIMSALVRCSASSTFENPSIIATTSTPSVGSAETTSSRGTAGSSTTSVLTACAIYRPPSER